MFSEKSAFRKGVLALTRKSLRFISAVLAIIISVIGLSSCQGDSQGGSADLGNISGNYQMIIDSVDKINCDYLLVYRTNSSYAELDAYVAFLETLTSSSNATFQICPDTLNVTDAEQKVILLGGTSYNESTVTSTLMKDIRANNYYDYLIRGYDNNVVSVMWMSKFGREDAFRYIVSNLLNNDFDRVFDKQYSYMYLSDRSDTPVVTIDDINIMQYSVVMPGSPSYIERRAAERLVRVIRDATGIEVPLVTDAVEESSYEILVGDTNRIETYVTKFFSKKRYAMAQYNTKMILRGGQVEATAQAVQEFADMVSNASLTASPMHIKSNYCTTGSIKTYGGSSFDGYELIFSDEFNAEGLNEKIWRIDEGSVTCYGDAIRLMNFTKGSIKSDTGNIIIRTDLGQEGYRSGHITTENSFSFQYGYVETRAKFRSAPGLWVKMILTNQNDKKDSVSQIDVFNSLGSKDTVFASAGVLDAKTYYSEYLKLNEPYYEANRTGAFEYGRVLNDDDYHTYGVEWTPEYIRFFIDGVSYGTVETTSPKYKDLQTQMYLEYMIGVDLTEQVTVDEVSAWPIDFCVDWVRVYQRPNGISTDRTMVTVEQPKK